jgi:hypothetical protein
MRVLAVLGGALILLPAGATALAEEPEIPDPPVGECKLAPSPVDVPIDETRYPESAAHWKAAIAAGRPAVLTLNRTLAPTHRAQWEGQVVAEPGYDRDEYPFAATDEGGLDATRAPSIRYISPSDNRGSGSRFKAALAGYCDGTKFRVRFVRSPNPEPWEGDWRTDYGILSVWRQTGTDAFGVYMGPSRLDAKVSKRRLGGDWFGASGRKGTLTFTLSGDENRFTGRWSLSDDRRPIFRGWAGTRDCQTWQADLAAPGPVQVSPRALRPEDGAELVNREREGESVVRGRITTLRSDPRARPAALSGPVSVTAPAWVRTAGARVVLGAGARSVEVPPYTEVRIGKGAFRAGAHRAVMRTGEPRFLEVIPRHFCPTPEEYNGPSVPTLQPQEPAPPAGG